MRQSEQVDKEVKREAKKYWASLSEEERKKIAVQYFVNGDKADIIAKANKIDNDNIDRKIEQRRKIKDLEYQEWYNNFSKPVVAGMTIFGFVIIVVGTIFLFIHGAISR